MEVSTDKDRLDRQMIYQFLHHEAYWSKGRSWAAVQSSIEHSLCFGVYENGKQIGFARVVSDYTIFGWLLDVFVVPSHRGQALTIHFRLSITASGKKLGTKNPQCAQSLRAIWFSKPGEARNTYGTKQ
ncbi:MAG: GNAT family N-acetyltransferase [Bacteroidota bacterium]